MMPDVFAAAISHQRVQRVDRLGIGMIQPAGKNVQTAQIAAMQAWVNAGLPPGEYRVIALDLDHSAASRGYTQAFVNSGYFDLARDVARAASLRRATDRMALNWSSVFPISNMGAKFMKWTFASSFSHPAIFTSPRMN